MFVFYFFFIAFAASIVGAINGIGGGILIKPILDAVGILEINAITFLSGCTVLSMSGFSIILARKKNISINVKISGFLAFGSILGGILGKNLFNYVLLHTDKIKNVEIIQSSILIVLSLGVIIFTLNKKKIKPLKTTHYLAGIPIGLLLGITGAFLGIGGGPINLPVLYLFFALDTKFAVINSLFIIFFSQLSGLLMVVATRMAPDFNPLVLFLMIIGGISGAIIGSSISKKISSKTVDKLFITTLTLIICLCARNIYTSL